MRHRSFASLITLSAAFAVLLSVPARTQNLPRTLDGKPDFSGVWASVGFKHVPGAQHPDAPTVGLTRFFGKDLPVRSGAEKLWNRQLNGDARNDDPTLLCLPWGFPFHTLTSNVQHWFQPPGYLVIVYEDMHFTRIIHMDGRAHPSDVGLTYYGNSVGKYEGDTAVIDTIGLKPWGMDGGGNHMHSDAAHYIERYTRTGPTTMSYELTIDDPKIFTKPFTCGAPSSHCFAEKSAGPETFVMRLHPEWEVIEQYCEDNNKDPGLIDYLSHPK